MKVLHLLSAKFIGILSVTAILALISGCRKESDEAGIISDTVPVMLKSGQATDFIVISKNEVLPAGLAKKLSSLGEIVSMTPEIGVMVVKPFAGNFREQAAKLSEVRAVVPDYNTRWIEPSENVKEVTVESIGDNELFFGYQWNMRAISAPLAWDAGYTGAGARVFILDNGIDSDNPDIRPNLNTRLSCSFVPGETCYASEGSFFNHGTHVAGIIAGADNQWGIIGVAPHAEIVAVKVLRESTGTGSFSWIFNGIVYSALNGADVINMSLGALIDRAGFYQDEDGNWYPMPAADYQSLIIAQQRAIDYAWRSGAVVVASAGNDGVNADGNFSLIKVPGDLNNVLAVSATAPECWVSQVNPFFDFPASYTDYGRSLVDLAAPGGDYDCDPYGYDMILSSTAGGPLSYTFYFGAGTSQAAPHVAGVAALVIGKHQGNISPLEVTRILMQTADKIETNGTSLFFGKGRVNAYRAVTETTPGRNRFN
jgi:subtilisin family serine protease